MNRYLVGFDIGTQGSKAIITDTKGNIIARNQIDHKIQVLKPGYQEENMNIWWNEFKESIKYFLDSYNIKAEEIKVIGITGLVPGLCLIDREGNPVRNSILHTDVRAVNELEYVNEKLNISISHGCMLPKLMWVKNNEPENYKKTYKVMVPHGYIAYRLTGETTIDYDTSTIIGGIFDEIKLQWIDEKIEILELDRNIFPNSYPSNHVIGNITERAAKETGLSTATKVIVGTGDSFASMLGGGAYEKKYVMLYLGSSTTIVYAEDSPKNYVELPHFGDNRGEFLGKILSFGESVSHLKNTLRYEGWEELEEGLRNIPAGSEGLYYMPHYKQQTQSSFFGLDGEFILGFRGKHSQFHIYKALIEGISYNIRANFNSFHKDIDMINVFGGGANSLELCQIIADVLGRELHLSNKKCTALGIAFLAGYGSGEIKEFSELNNWYKDDIIIKPKEENVRVYNNLFPKYEKIKRSIYELDSILE